jgi:hypothetical protein
MTADLRRAIDTYRVAAEARLTALKAVQDVRATERAAKSQWEAAAKDERDAFFRLLAKLDD